MKQIINIILKIKHKSINLSKKIKPHITLVYPFEDFNQQDLIKHIENSIEGIKPFQITLKGLKKSAKDYYLYLLVSKGKNKIIKLHKKLNSGILKYVKNKDMPRYIPHITLGVFKSKKEINSAMKNSLLKNQEYSTKVNSIQLLTLNKNNPIKSIKNFRLN